MLNLFRTFLLVSFIATLAYYYSGSDGSIISRRATSSFITQCSPIVPNMVALSILSIGPHLNEWLAALAIQNTKVTFFLNRQSLSNSALVQQLYNAGHNIAIDALAEPLTASNIVATIQELGNLIGPVIGNTPRFYTFSNSDQENMASIALSSGLYAVGLNTQYLQSGNIISQVSGVTLTPDQSILAMVDSTSSQIDTTQFASFIAALKNGKNNLVSLTVCTQKTSAYNLWYATNASPTSPAPASTSTNSKVYSSGNVAKWLFF